MRKPLAALAALAGIGMLAAPTAGADPTPSVPGDPTGPIYNPPGYIGYYPGAYGFQSIWSLTPPSRFVDGGNTGARSNADPEASGTGMPGDRLGVQDNRAVVKGIGPSSQVRGVRTGKAVPSSAQEDNAGGVLPGATAATGQADPVTGQPLALENPDPAAQAAPGAAPQAPPPGPESQQPGAGPLAAPGVSDWWTIRARR
ncbi:hypothetical protein MINS_40830 [Mycolicibacterium insubricum]|uniref:Uncharacterized protein n=1 Tax=Mycolicibacterium insubricum TaxID=444597 RepID=A0A1X0DE81_9MYCO|nr:hypothetical protein [Mycolicibacterium insubricum]MCB9438700.1 hypothetical protein [Mycolicibacterium sp.]ORA70110.1 hypothetical protein BST26_11825 [Mycolicibacterium insubricum]BBZ68654.1 hypothetical protein MINS_40830 [Mycolicibacterium insubricum]